VKTFIFFLSLLVLPVVAHAEWIRTSGPEGGDIHSLDLVDGLLFAGTDTDGIYASDDAGLSWAPMNSGMKFASVRRVVRKGNYLYAASRDGVYRSGDGGVTWASPAETSPGNVHDLAVTTHYVFATAGGIYRSADDGLTWEVTDVFQGADVVGASGDTLLAGGGSDIWRSTDEGDTWDRLEGMVSHVTFSIYTAADTMFVGRQGDILRSYDAGETFDVLELPIAFSIVNAYDFARLGSNLYVGTSSDGIYMSTDLGDTWAPAQDGMGLKDVESIQAVGSTLVAGTHYCGVYRSEDAGASWQKANEGLLAGAAVLEMLTDGDTVYAGTRDGLYRTKDDGDTWTKLTGGDDYAEYGWVWGIAIQDGQLFMSATYDHFHARLFRRDGETWTRVDAGLPEDIAFIFGLTTSGDNLLAGTDQGLYYSTDLGESWHPAIISPNSGVDEVSAAGNGTVYATLTNEGIFRSLDDGVHWNRSLQIPNFTGLSGCGNYGFASDLTVGFWYTPDNGSGWYSVNLGGHAYDVKCIDGGLVLVATGLEGEHILISYDNGNNFETYTEGLIPSASAEEFSSTDRYMFAGMDHTGVWRRLRPDATAVEPGPVALGNADLWNYPNPFTGQTRIHFEMPVRGDAKLTIYDVAGRRVRTLVNGDKSAGGHDIAFDGARLPAGVYLYELEAGGRTVTGKMVKVDTRP